MRTDPDHKDDGGILGRILHMSIERRWLVLVATLAVALLGVYNFRRLPIDAVPDITNVQVQVNTTSKALSTPEVEQRLTFPVEWAMGGLPGVSQVRSLSRYGLSQVTVVFEDGTDIYRARQLIAERLNIAKESLPPETEPQMGPIATGLGEIYMYTIRAKPGATQANGQPYGPTELRTLQDWVVRPQLRTVAGVTEVNTIGGFEKLYQVAPDPAKLVSYKLSFRDVFDALVSNNANAGGGYVEKNGEQYLIRSTGLVQGIPDISNILVGSEHGVPIRIGALADVGIGRDLRTGAATNAGEEVVIGTAIMLAGENSRLVSTRVDERLKTIGTALPPGVELKTLYNRTYLVDATLSTVKKNLLEGAILVIVVLFLMLGNIRAALIAALAIPLSMLIALTGMVETKISGNLMSLGAIDFGLIVDGSVIIVENCIRRFAEEQHRLGRVLTREERLALAFEASQSVRKATIFGEIIIAVVYLPILTLQGVEGKMFTPMAQTVILALAGATILSMTFIPAMVAIFLTGKVKEEDNFAVKFAKRVYDRVLRFALGHRFTIVASAVGVLALSAFVATRLGSEFAPKLSEGAIAIGSARLPSSSLTKSLEMQMALEKKLKASFPDEIAEIFARTGTAEVATDPMGPNMSDMYMMLTPRERWTRAKTQEELAVAMDKVIDTQPGQLFEITQPIELRFNELISGVRSDVAVKIFGDDLDTLRTQALKVSAILNSIPGGADVKVEQTTGLPVLTIDVLRDSAARFGLNVADVQLVVETAIGGRVATKVLESDRRFNMVMRLPDAVRKDVKALENLPIQLPKSVTDASPEVDTHVQIDTGLATSFVPLGAVAKISLQEGPNQISHETGKRRIVVQANVRGRDLGGFVAEAERRINEEVKLPTGYWIAWGGQFENLIAARGRLAIVVPVALSLIFGLLYLSFGSVKNALLIFSGVPLALTGGVVALYLRGLNFSISAAIGFIALSGVAVLNGLVIVTFIENLRDGGMSVDDAIQEGAMERLRPVLMTALVAALGFVPMAIATGMGSEVQRPLATVVIGGIISSTALTLVVLPVLYRLTHRDEPVGG